MVSLFFLVVLTICCTSAAQIFEKRAALRSLASVEAVADRGVVYGLLLKHRDFLISLVLLGIGLLLWLVVLARLDVSIAYPLLSLSYVVVMIAAKLFFDEQIPLHRWVGAFLIIAGIGLLVGEINPGEINPGEINP